MEAEQTENGKTERNDRLIAVPDQSRDYSDVNSLDDLNSNMLKEIEQFFITYNQREGQEIQSSSYAGAAHARKMVKRNLL